MNTSIKTLYLSDEMRMLKLGAALARACNDHAILFLKGQLGAGKSTLVRGFLRALGITESIKSPTYSLVESYLIDQRYLFHFDFYRLNSADELENIGFHDYVLPNAICLIEWPENVLSALPQPDLACDITLQLPGRKVSITAYTDSGHRILSALNERQN